VDRATRERRDRLQHEVGSRPEARLELAELYRDLGHVDQAGRWGISVDGWARARELDAYAALLRQKRPDAESMLRRLSGFDRSQPLTADAIAVLEDVAAAEDPVSPLTGWRAQVDVASRITSAGVAAIGLIVVVVMMFIVFGSALAGSDEDLTAPARVGVVVGAFVFALAAAFRLPASILRRQWVRVGLLVVIALALGAFFVTFAPSADFVYPDGH